MATKILMQTNQHENNNLQLGDYLESKRLEIEEPLSECGSSVGSSLTMTTMSHTIDDVRGLGLLNDDDEDGVRGVGGACRARDSRRDASVRVAPAIGAREVTISDPLGRHGGKSLMSSEDRVDPSDAWMFYQVQYEQLNDILHMLHNRFVECVSVLSKREKKQIEMIKIENYVPKGSLKSFEKCLNATDNGKPLDHLSSGRFASIEFKLWKKHYCSLLDGFDIVYKDCQLLNRLQSNKSELDKVASSSGKSLLSEFEIVFSKFLTRCQLSNIISNSDNSGFDISTAFLIDLIAQCRIFRGELERLTATKDRLFYILKTAKEQRSKLKVYVSNLRNDLRTLLSKMKLVQTNHTTLDPATCSSKTPTGINHNVSGIIVLSQLEKQDYQKRIEDLERILKEEELRRKKLHNKLQELIGNIRVYCRIRPQPRSFLKITSEDKLIVVGDCLPERITKHWYGKVSKCFIFDRVFGPKSDQIEVFESVDELITSCVDGYNVCIMAYGQTGSGKTHTMMGTVQEPGVNRRAIYRLLNICDSRLQWKYRLFLSMVEIYQEEVRDILAEKATANVKIMSNQDDEIMLQGLTEHEVKCENDIFKYFDKGEKNRTVASTLLNISSSRSHLIVLLKVYGENRIHLTTSMGTLTLCDLAGSENITKSGATGERFNEATCINKSLTTLGRVFDSLRHHQKPSYRETKLTYLLKPTLGGDSKCLLFVNVRCEPENAEETLRAIHFGINAMQVAPEKAQQRSKFRKTLGKITV